MIGSLTAYPLLGNDFKTEVLPDHAGDCAPNGVRLPARARHHLGNGRAAGMTHRVDDRGELGAGANGWSGVLAFREGIVGSVM